MLRLACDRCKAIEAQGGAIPEWAKEWWESHKAADAQRARESAEVRRQNKIREKALKKLTPEERNELGI